MQRGGAPTTRRSLRGSEGRNEQKNGRKCWLASAEFCCSDGTLEYLCARGRACRWEWAAVRVGSWGGSNDWLRGVYTRSSPGRRQRQVGGRSNKVTGCRAVSGGPCFKQRRRAASPPSPFAELSTESAVLFRECARSAHARSLRAAGRTKGRPSQEVCRMMVAVGLSLGTADLHWGLAVAARCGARSAGVRAR